MYGPQANPLGSLGAGTNVTGQQGFFAANVTGQQGFFHVESPYVIRNLKDRLLKRRNELADHVAHGGAGSYEQYKELVGTMAGLLEAVDMLDELEKLERN